ncbi:TPA_asm: protein 4 [Holcus virus 1]|uniref:Protein 4 n=1 Tax=Holcus virus 1 TaxID=2984270 RepID=A0A9N6YJF0_9RHAB|nr:TPA_asm: protein 4 [Holcus virus 1]
MSQSTELPGRVAKTIFSSPDVMHEMRWLIAESKCLIIKRACEITISDLYHYIPTLNAVNAGVGISHASCVRCSDGTIWPGYYLSRDDVLDLLSILNAEDHEIDEAYYLMNEEFCICTECILCAIVHKSPKKLLMSVLNQTYDIISEGLWPYDPVSIREIAY